jgi:gas vesicle protein
MDNNRSSNSMLAFVAGIGIGALVGILFAPRSGEETREQLMGGAMDAIDTVTSTGQRFAQNTRQAVTDTTEQLRQSVNDRTEQVRRAVNDRADQVRQSVNDTADQVKQVVGDTAERVSDAVQEGQRAYTKARSA